MRPFGDDSTIASAASRYVRPSLKRFAPMLLLLCLAGTDESLAQETKGGEQVTSIFVYPVEEQASTAGPASNELRSKVVKRLEQVKSIHIAREESSAGAALRVKAVIWSSGTVTLNPKSHSGSVTNYDGYASAYLYSHEDASKDSRRVIWTYLATPKRFHFAGTVDDLSEQIADALARKVATGFSTEGSSARGASGGLKVAGATFPAPLYLKWFQSFGEQKDGVPMTYDPVGSVRGVEELASGSVDMAASDIPATSGDTTAGSTVRIPSVVGAIVPIYSLGGGSRAGSHEDLGLSGPLLADIYAGRITRWDDPAIVAANHSVALPHAAIAVIHRSDGSGTTFVWTSYLAQASGNWKLGAGATIDWPTGVGVAGNEGVAEEVARTPNSIGYVELAYAIQHHLNYAAVRNPAGRSIKADLETVSAAAETANGTSSASLINSTAKDSYPITTFTWLVVPQSIADHGRRASVNAFLHWMLTSGQRQCAELGYAPLPRKIANEELHKIEAIK